MYYPYPKLKKLEKIGASLCPKCPAMQGAARTANEKTLSGDEFRSLLLGGKLVADTTYVLADKEALTIASDATVDATCCEASCNVL